MLALIGLGRLERGGSDAPGARQWLLPLLFVLLFAAAPAGASAREPGSVPDLSVITDSGAAQALARVGDTLVLGGDFTRLWYRTGPGAILGGPNGTVDRLGPRFAGGKVMAAISDGEGGWYVGGSFTQVGSAGIARLAHVESDGAVDRGWAPNPDGPVRALALDAAGEVVVGGEFTTIGAASAARNTLAAIDASGEATSWDPDLDGTVNAVAVGPDDTVFAGGTFTTAGGVGRARLAAFAPMTRELTSWNPTINQGAVNALVATGSAIYAGGSFTTVGAVPTTRNRLASFDPDSGEATSWDPNMGGTVNALALAPSGTLYAGGAFTTAGGNPRSRIASFDTASATVPLNAWAPSVNGTVNALSVDPQASGSVYLAGSFSNVAGSSRSRLAKLDAAGAATSWNPGPYGDGFDGNPVTLSAVAASGAKVFVGGTVVALNPVSRPRMAAIDLRDGSILPFNPKPDETVNALAAGPGDSVYVGGSFTEIGATPVPRAGVAQLSLATGEATAWDPNPRGPGGETSFVLAIAYSAATDTTYLGGGFAQVGPTGSSQPRKELAAVDATTGEPTAWNPGIGEYPYTLAVSPDGTAVYAGGRFATVGTPPVARPRLAALAAATGDVLPLDPAPNEAVTRILVEPDGETIVVGGYFSEIAGESNPGIAILDAASGALDSGSPGGGENFDIARGDSTHLFAGGFIEEVGGSPRENAAGWAADAGGNYQPTDFAPHTGQPVLAIAASPENAVFLGGFLYFEEGGNTGFASFTPPPASTAPPQVTGPAALGATLTATPGTWAGEGRLGQRYQWLRCTAAGTECEEIPGAKQLEYAVGAADVGQTLRFRDTVVTVSAEAEAESAGVTIPAPVPVFAVAPGSGDFGTVAVGGRVRRGFEVTNAGAAALEFGPGAVALTGADAAQFAIESDTCSAASLAAGEKCAVDVAFAPTSAGVKGAALELTDNAGDSPQPVPLSGSGASDSGGGSGGAGAGPSPSPPPPTAPLAAQLIGTRASVSGGKATLSLRCPAASPGPCAAKLVLQTAPPPAAAEHEKKRLRKYGSASFRIGAGATRKLRVPLTALALRQLANHGHLRAYALLATAGTSAPIGRWVELVATAVPDR